MNGSHPLLDPYAAPSIGGDGEIFGYDDGRVLIDATPLYLFGVIMGAAAILAALKWAGFRFVIGVGQ